MPCGGCCTALLVPVGAFSEDMRPDPCRTRLHRADRADAVHAQLSASNISLLPASLRRAAELSGNVRDLASLSLYMTKAMELRSSGIHAKYLS